MKKSGRKKKAPGSKKEVLYNPKHTTFRKEEFKGETWIFEEPSIPAPWKRETAERGK